MIARALIALLLLAAAACASGEGSRHDLGPLVTIEDPPLERLEPAVRQQLQDARARVAALGEDSRAHPNALGAAHAELGRLYQTYELFESAIPCYRNASTLLPDDPRWPYYLGRVFSSLGRSVEARGAFERTLVLAPDDLPARIALGRTYLAAGDFDRSQLEAQGALEIDPESASAMLLLAETATDSGEFAVAVQWYESLLAQQPEANRLYKPLALAYRGAGREEDARRALGLAGEERVRLSDPLMQALRPGAKGALSFRQSGIAAFQRGDYATAEVQFRRAIELAPDYEGDRLNLGSTLTQLGRLEEAADEMRAVLAMNPAHALAQYNLGVVLDALGRRPEAIEAYTAALRIEPSAYRPRFNLATALREEGRCVTALEEYARILHGFPGDRSARVGEALCLVSEGSFDRAREGLESALSDSPGDPWLTYVTSRLLAASPQSEMRDGARALELARSLVEIQVSPGNLETLAMALAEVGRFDEAIATQTEAIELAATEAREALFPRLRENLERYKQRVPAREPALG